MSTYYEYRDVKVMIAHKLVNMDGWKVCGYSPDNNNLSCCRFRPAHWDGVAEKNGYILCVNVYGEAKPEEIRKYNHSAFKYDHVITEKIKKLEQMTVDRGASEQEETSAKMMIERLQRKAETATENIEKYTVIGVTPGHLANPPRCNWHIEKDGIIIEKGTGLLKFVSLHNYYNYDNYMQDMQMWRKDKTNYVEKHAQDLVNHSYYDDIEQARKSAESHVKKLEKDSELMDRFENLISKIDTACGGLLGEGEGFIYEKIIVTEYKNEMKSFEVESGSLKEGQCFILKTGFNYNRYKGLVYRIHEREYDGRKSYYAYKLNGKLTKECTGQASVNNRWGYIDETWLKWVEKGSIAWCELREVKTPYEVEKVIKKKIGEEKKTSYQQSEVPEETATENKNLEYEIEEGEHTKTHEKLWLVKIKTSLSKDEFKNVKRKFAVMKGYYSSFTHSFIFKYNPTEQLETA